MAFDPRSLDALKFPYVLLEDRLAGTARLYQNPVAIVACDRTDGVEEAFARIERGFLRGLHAAGLFSYELGYALEPRLAASMPANRNVPLLWFGLFEPPQSIAAAELDEAFAGLGPPPPIRAVEPAHDRALHAGKVKAILGRIGAGDVYQANLTFPIGFRYDGDRLALYGALRARQPVAHGGIAALGDTTILSVSPELWLRVASDEATTRPMKGTIGRGMDATADQSAIEALTADPKQRAENLMIVDLMRNDLGRISDIGTVRVPNLFQVETYPGFHTMTSTVTARLKPDLGLLDRVKALFPCGSIVGAPKIRAAEIIRDLEAEPRGFYTGALGAIAPNRDMDFNVAIRTAVITKAGIGRYGVGGGIVADSDPDAEYEEALLKARVLSDLATDFSLVETLRWSRTHGYIRLPLHLDRLAASAQKLGFRFERAETEAKLVRLAAAWDGDRRVRLALSRAGEASVTQAPVTEAPTRLLRVGIADQKLDPGDPFLRHKTTRRAVYEQAYEEAIAAGLDEALFLNRRDQVAEASRNSVFARIKGRLITPSLRCGLLPGVLRRMLIDTGQAIEGDFGLADLRQASAWFLGNSLHGLREAVLA